MQHNQGSRFLPIACLWVIASLGQAAPYIWDFDDAEECYLPTWINPMPQPGQSFFAKAQFQIQAPQDLEALAVTVYFQEVQGSFLRAFWGDWPNQTVLSQNLYEGTGMSNQRTLVIPIERLRAGNTLSFQSGIKQQPITRIHFLPLESAPIYMPRFYPETPGLLLDARRILPMHEVDGLPPLPEPDAWDGKVFRAILTQNPMRVEKGVSFIVELEENPVMARIEAKFTGLPAHVPIRVWVNNEVAGVVNIHWPSLSDPGYIVLGVDHVKYSGWQTVSCMLAQDSLRIGNNTIIFDWRKPGEDGPLPSDPVALKDFILELEPNPNPDPPLLSAPLRDATALQGDSG